MMTARPQWTLTVRKRFNTGIMRLETDEDMLFFTRVPKTGSTTMTYILKSMSLHNNFTHRDSTIHNRRRLDLHSQGKLMHLLSRLKKPVVYERHLYFMNFTRTGLKMPLYLGVVREPAEKFNSRFYYHRSGNFATMHRKLIAAGTVNLTIFEWKKMSLDECLNRSLPECTMKDEDPYDLAIPYFCGQEIDCSRHNNRWALAKAILNVQRFYPVVGVLEMFNETLALMEHKLPTYFRNVTNLPKRRKNKTPRKQPLSQMATEYLRRSLVTEIQFYQFLVQRLKRQYSQLIAKNHTTVEAQIPGNRTT